MTTEFVSFDRPPVVEVALAVHFEPLAKLNVALVGAFWTNVREDYPLADQRARIDPFVEIEDNTLQTQVYRINVGGAVEPLPCSVFFSEDRTRVVQVQADMFVHNWRRSGELPYPRYSEVRAGFVDNLRRFLDFLQREHVGPWAPVQAEVTYVNHVEPSETWARHGQLDRILAPWSGAYSNDFLTEPEDVALHVRHPFRDEETGAFLGRLHVDVKPVRRMPGGEPVYAIALTARGGLDGDGIDSVMSALDNQRKQVVLGFKSITSQAARTEWGEH